MAEATDELFAKGGEIDRMVRLAVSRKLRMFDEYGDLDFESLHADAMGEVVRAWHNYNPAKSKPGSHAYRVAWARLIDICRRRTNETKYQNQAILVEGVKLSEVGPAEVCEGTDAELAEVLRRFYVFVKDYLEDRDIPVHPKHLGRCYMNRAQRGALSLLQRRMEWSPRKAEKVIQERPAILAGIGVTQTPSRQFFVRAALTVTQLTKIPPTASSNLPAA